jgi:hypothetical protein
MLSAMQRHARMKRRVGSRAFLGLIAALFAAFARAQSAFVGSEDEPPPDLEPAQFGRVSTLVLATWADDREDRVAQLVRFVLDCPDALTGMRAFGALRLMRAPLRPFTPQFREAVLDRNPTGSLSCWWLEQSRPMSWRDAWSERGWCATAMPEFTAELRVCEAIGLQRVGIIACGALVDREPPRPRPGRPAPNYVLGRVLAARFTAADPGQQVAAVLALRHFGTEARPCLDALAGALPQMTPRALVEVPLSVHQVAPECTAAFCARLFDHSEPTVVRAALEAGCIVAAPLPRDPEFARKLARCLASAAWTPETPRCSWFSKLADARVALPELTLALHEHPENGAILEAIGDLGPDALSLASDLEQIAAAHPDGPLHSLAENALRALRAPPTPPVASTPAGLQASEWTANDQHHWLRRLSQMTIAEQRQVLPAIAAARPDEPWLPEVEHAAMAMLDGTPDGDWLMGHLVLRAPICRCVTEYYAAHEDTLWVPPWEHLGGRFGRIPAFARMWLRDDPGLERNREAALALLRKPGVAAAMPAFLMLEPQCDLALLRRIHVLLDAPAARSMNAALRPWLFDCDAAIRRTALEAIVALRTSDEEAHAAFFSARYIPPDVLAGSLDAVSAEARRFLDGVAAPPGFVDDVRQQLRSDTNAALERLGQVPDWAGPLVPDLTPLLHNGDSNRTTSILRILAHCGPAAAGARREVEELLPIPRFHFEAKAVLAQLRR